MSEEPILVDEPITVRVVDALAGWCCIERKVHDGRHWLVRTEYGFALMCSSRISDADVEGDTREIEDIARAVLARESVFHRRCGVRIDGEFAYFSSPRNSMREAKVPLVHADAMAREVLGGAE